MFGFNINADIGKKMTINSINSAQSPSNINNKKKIKAGAIIGSAAGIAASVAGVYLHAKKGNPAASIKNLAYSEADVLLIGAGSVLGGLAGGVISDKKPENVKPKLREASQQFIGNMVFPIGTMALGHKLLDKANIKMPQIPSTSKIAQTANTALKVLPKTVVTVASLMGGMEIGNKVMNKINNKVFKEEVHHDVKPEDYLVHADDICLTANMVLKDTKAISAVTSKVLPLTFLVSGAKTGIQQASSCESDN